MESTGSGRNRIVGFLEHQARLGHVHELVAHDVVHRRRPERPAIAEAGPNAADPAADRLEKLLRVAVYRRESAVICVEAQPAGAHPVGDARDWPFSICG